MENSISVSQIHQVQTCKSMQRLKFELVNGYGVLVDEKGKIEEGDWYLFLTVKGSVIRQYSEKIHFGLEPVISLANLKAKKIIFAEKELNLEGVPTFEWRDFDEDEIAESVLRKQNWDTTITLPFNQGFIQGYKSNPAKYTESDLEDLLIAYNKARDNDEHFFIDEYIKSLQKYPSYIEVDGIIENKANIVNVIW